MLVQSKEESGISFKLLRVAWLLFDLDKKDCFYGTDTPLYEAEIHLIVAINENPGLHVAGLAQKFGVTKGAISQLVQKLEAKVMISKQRDPDNRSKIQMNLTDKGQVAYEAHARLHQDFDQMVARLLKNEPEEHRLFLKRFLSDMAREIESNEE